MDFYNGYTPQEREKKLRAMHKAYPGRSHPYYSAPCHICWDSEAKVAPHSEDYSEPYLWERPAVYALCATCHGRLHKRFKNPFAWEAYKRHLKRGGVGADLKRPPIAREVGKLAKALSSNKPFNLAPLRPFDQPDLWWDRLSVDPRSLTGVPARITR
jgi:hypothetical protein